MKKYVLFSVLITFLSSSSEAQIISETANLDINNVNAIVNSNGYLFNDSNISKALYEVPKGSGKTPLYANDIWICGENANNVLSLKASLFEPHNYSEGPMALSYNTSWSNRFARLWNLKKTDIDHHRQNWNKANYTMIDDILNWPAHGDTTNGEAYNLAPYIDYNVDGIYTPQYGDFPCIKGDQAIYTITNEDKAAKSKWVKFPLEIHTMTYSYAQNNALNNTVFVEYRIVNRSTFTYYDTYIGIWQDFDIGCANDDNIGCDTNLNVFYAYNGDAYDEDCLGALGYDSITPFFGTVFLSEPMKHFLSYDRGLDPHRGDAITEEDHCGYLKSIWMDGQHVVHGGYGHPRDTNATSQKTNYMYPGDPRDTTAWSDYTSGLLPFDRRGIGSTGPFTLLPGEVIELTVANVFTQNPSKTWPQNLDVFDDFKKDVVFVQNFYDAQTRYCPNWVTGIEEEKELFDVKVYPNPANDILTVEFSDVFKTIDVIIYDAYGKLIDYNHKITSVKTEIDVSDLPGGLYFLQFSAENEVFVKKVIVE